VIAAFTNSSRSDAARVSITPPGRRKVGAGRGGDGTISESSR
jgi:hypothetical protein